MRGASRWLPQVLPGLLLKPLHHPCTVVFVRPESTALLALQQSRTLRSPPTYSATVQTSKTFVLPPRESALASSRRVSSCHTKKPVRKCLALSRMRWKVLDPLRPEAVTVPYATPPHTTKWSQIGQSSQWFSKRPSSCCFYGMPASPCLGTIFYCLTLHTE